VSLLCKYVYAVKLNMGGKSVKHLTCTGKVVILELTYKYQATD